MPGTVAISYTGITAGQIRSLSGAIPIGKTPGRFTIDVRDDATPAAVGTLAFSDGYNGTISLAQCALVSSRWSGRGQRRLTLEDRRWRWRTGYIDGHYNKRRPKAVDKLEREKTPRELAGLLFTALNELVRDVSLLPNDARPEVQWIQANPADELERLCSSLGCVIAPNLTTGGWKIWPIGQGTTASGGDWLKTLDIDTAVRPVPDQIAIACGPVEFEAVFLCEAVGVDTDGKIKPINELSFAPAGGWKAGPETHDGITGEYKKHPGDTRKLSLRNLARQTVWKWYRIKSMPAGAGPDKLNPPGYDYPVAVSAIEQFLPLIPSVNSFSLDGKERGPAEVFGEFTDFKLFDTGTSPPGTPFTNTWTLDTARGIVKFEAPQYLYDATKDPGERYDAAKVYLKCAARVEDTTIGSPVYYARFLTSGSTQGAGAEVVRRPDIVLRFEPDFSADGTLAAAGDPDSNLAEVDAECEYHLATMAAEYAPANAGTIRLSGLHAVELNGQQREVAFAADTRQPPQTTIGVNGSANPYTPDYKVIQRQSRFKGELLGDLAKLNRSNPGE